MYINQVFKTLIFLIFLSVSNQLLAQTDTVYIDPGYSGATKSGTKTNPYNSLGFTWKSNTPYVFKRGYSLALNQGTQNISDLKPDIYILEVNIGGSVYFKKNNKNLTKIFVKTLRKLNTRPKNLLLNYFN